MSLLPQRKKSAEEIAKLRENLGIPGIPGQSPNAEESPVSEPLRALPAIDSRATAENDGAGTPAQVAALPTAAKPSSAAPSHPQKPARSLKKTEHVPVAAAAPEELMDTPVVRPPQRQKIVRSLRKSEQVPLTPANVHPAADDSKLPNHRHSDRELNEIRRQAAINMQAPAFNPSLQIAHLAWVIPGYLFALAGGLCFYHYELSLTFTASCVGVSLLIAGFIFLKRPFSRHHAAFISVIALFVIVFGALYYFPQLRHGT